MNALGSYILRETAIGVLLNTMISAVFFLLLFGGAQNVVVWGSHGLVADCVPQGFLAGLASVLPPSLLARARMARNAVPLAIGVPPRLPRSLLTRCLFLALFSMVALTGTAALLALVSGAQSIAFWPALMGKMLIGALLAIVLTPIALRAMLVRPA